MSVVGFEFLTNHKTESLRIEESTVSLPMVNISYLNDATTTLHGYVRAMNASFMRDALIPLEGDRQLNLDINLYGYEFDSIEYEVRSLDAERKLSGNEIKDYKLDNGILSTTIQIENLIEDDEEYQLVIIIHKGEKSVYYYTRIISSTDGYEKQCITFARGFHKAALEGDGESIERYLETSADSNKDTLYNVDIHSSLDQITYKEFDGEVVGRTDITITDTTPVYTTIAMDFLMSRKNGKNPEYYNVHEYFRVRYTTNRTYLLDYSRTMEQILSFETMEFDENLVNIGLSCPQVSYLSNETGTIIAFVANGELYQYNQNERQMKRIFSFIGENHTDKRRILTEHTVRILNIDESGTMDYVVYGYMNAGDHEGECGINLFHYDSLSGKSTEQIFIESGDSYEILRANFSELLYETSNNVFYILVGGTLVSIDLSDMSYTEIMSDLKESQYSVSDSGRYLAYIEEEDVAKTIHIVDLETYAGFDINSPAGCLLKPLTFMDDDLVYGVVNKDTIVNDGVGTIIYPSQQIVISRITDKKESQLMSYKKSGYFVSDIVLDGYTLYLDRITIDDGTIYVAEQDAIKNSSGEQNQAVPIELKKSPIKGQEVILTLAKLPAKETLGKVDMVDSDIVVGDVTRSISVTTANMQEQYYVYYGNKVSLATDSLIRAITEADDSMGVVIDSRQHYIWKRGKKSYVNAMSNVSAGTSDESASATAKAISAILVHEGENVQVHAMLEYGETPLSIIERTLKDVTVLDLTGASLDQVLYYINVGSPVLGVLGENEAIVIIGYEASSIVVYDPNIGGRRRIPIQEARNAFENAGNIFVSYVK